MKKPEFRQWLKSKAQEWKHLEEHCKEAEAQQAIADHYDKKKPVQEGMANSAHTRQPQHGLLKRWG